MLVPAMTVAENIALGGKGRRYRAEERAEQIRKVGTRYGLAIDPDAEVGTLHIERNSASRSSKH